MSGAYDTGFDFIQEFNDYRRRVQELERGGTGFVRLLYRTSTSSYPPRPAGASYVDWFGPVAPTVGGALGAKPGDSWTSSTA